jgi:hypothetical protein
MFDMVDDEEIRQRRRRYEFKPQLLECGTLGASGPR